MDNVQIIRIVSLVLLLLSLIIEKVFSVKYVYLIVFFVLWALTQLYEKKRGNVVYPKSKFSQAELKGALIMFVLVIILILYMLSFFIG